MVSDHTTDGRRHKGRETLKPTTNLSEKDILRLNLKTLLDFLRDPGGEEDRLSLYDHKTSRDRTHPHGRREERRPLTHTIGTVEEESHMEVTRPTALHRPGRSAVASLDVPPSTLGEGVSRSSGVEPPLAPVLTSKQSGSGRKATEGRESRRLTRTAPTFPTRECPK